MRSGRFVTYSVLAIAAMACSQQSGRELGYESAKSVGRLQCEQDFTVECPEPMSYREYEQAREEAISQRKGR